MTGSPTSFSIGQLGSYVLRNTLSYTPGKNIGCIYVLNDAVIAGWTSGLLPDGTTSVNAGNIIGLTLPAGIAIYGVWSQLQLTSGVVLVYFYLVMPALGNRLTIPYNRGITLPRAFLPQAVSDDMYVVGAGTAAANGLYENSVEGALWENEGGYVLAYDALNETHIAEIRTPGGSPDILYFVATGMSFPDGPWQADDGGLPLPGVLGAPPVQLIVTSIVLADNLGDSTIEWYTEFSPFSRFELWTGAVGGPWTTLVEHFDSGVRFASFVGEYVTDTTYSFVLRSVGKYGFVAESQEVHIAVGETIEDVKGGLVIGVGGEPITGPTDKPSAGQSAKIVKDVAGTNVLGPGGQRIQSK